MNILSNYFKRISALFLVCITIGFSSLSSYASVPVQASGVLEVSIISSLIEAVMASMGLSFSSTADLNNVVTGLDYMMTDNPDYTYGGVKIFEAIREALFNAKLGATVALPYACINWLSDWLYKISSDVISDASDVIHKDSSLSIPGTQVIYGDFSKEFFDANNLFSGFDYIYTTNANLITIFDDEPYLSSRLVVTVFNPYDNNFSISYTNAPCIIYPSALEPPEVLASKDNVTVNSVFNLYNASCNRDIFYSVFFKSKYFDSGLSSLTVGHLSYQKSVTIDNSVQYRLDFEKPNAYLSGSAFNTYDYSYILPASSSNAIVRVFVNNNTRLYESTEQYVMEKISATYQPSSIIYGSSGASKELEKDESAGTVYLQLTEAQLTEKIEQAVQDALIANPSITEEEINELVSEQIGSIEDVKDSVEENTEVLTSLSSIMTAIYETVKDISSAVNSFFVIDTAAIDTALAGFDTVWEEKVPFGGAITDMFDNFSFSEDYDYPVISMKTPDILKSFYAEDLIILCDFANYAVYCVWARNLVRALLWFSFGFSVVNHLKTDFHVG